MNIYSEKPSAVLTSRQLSHWLTEFHLSPRELTTEERSACAISDTYKDEQGEDHYQQAWTSIDAFYHHSYPLSESDYGPMVATIVRARYDANEVEAILNNYLADPENSEHLLEFQQLQQWRTQAKQVARMAINEASDYTK